MTFGISEQSYRQILQAIEAIPEIEEVLIFGSRSMGNFKPGSDIDLALKGERITTRTALNLAAQLNEALPIPYLCDVVAYAFLDNPELKQHIDCHGIKFFQR